MPVLALPATACFGSVCAAYRLGTSVPAVQKGGARKAPFRRKGHLPTRYDLLCAVCRRGALAVEARYFALEAPFARYSALEAP